MSDEKLKKLKRWSKAESNKVSSSVFTVVPLAEKKVWSKVLKRIEYYLHQK
jgi:hypothetical protein